MLEKPEAKPMNRLHQGSIHQRLATTVQRLAAHSLAFENVRLWELRLYNQEFDGDDPV